MSHNLKVRYALVKVKLLGAELCHTLCNPRDCSPQAPLSMEVSRQEYRSEWVATPFSDALLPEKELTGKRRHAIPFLCNLQGNLLPCKAAF